MSQYKTGTVSATNGSNVVTGSGTSWSGNVSAGQAFVIPVDSGGDGQLYDIASVDSDTQITLTANYSGDTVSGVAYAIHTGYTADNIPELARNDVATASLFTRAMRQIQTLFNQLTAKATGVATIAYTTDADRALTTTEARNRTLIVTESGVTLSATRQLSGFPEGEKTVINQTSATVRCIVSTGAHVDVPPASGGETGKRVVYCDGTDVNEATGTGAGFDRRPMQTAASTANYWAKLKTWTVSTAATSAISETLQLESVGTSPGSTASITVHAECDATGNLSSANSAVSVNAIIGSVFAYNGFMLVQPSAGTVELYVQAQAASAVVGVYETAAENDAGVTAVAYNDGATWISSTPSGSVTSAWKSWGPLSTDGTNVGVGATLETWSAPAGITALQVGDRAAIANFTGAGPVHTGNAYFDSGWKYQAADGAAILEVNSGGAGGYAFKVAPSGTADAAIAFITAITIDNNGDVSSGDTVPWNNSGDNPDWVLQAAGIIGGAQYQAAPGRFNRMGDDGSVVAYYQDGTLEGYMGVSGTTVSLTGAHLTRWSQWADGPHSPRLEILRGTVLSNRNEMCVWLAREGDVPRLQDDGSIKYVGKHFLYDGELLPGDTYTEHVTLEDGTEHEVTWTIVQEANEQLNKVVISDAQGDRNWAGVFQSYDEDDIYAPYDFLVARKGDFVIRVAQGVTVNRGDLLWSAGDGTAEPQPDQDSIGPWTICKVASTHESHVFDDGSRLIPVEMF